RGAGTARTTQAKWVAIALTGTTAATSQTTAAAGCRHKITTSTTSTCDWPARLGHDAAAQQDDAKGGRQSPAQPAQCHGLWPSRRCGGEVSPRALRVVRRQSAYEHGGLRLAVRSGGN